MQSHTSQAREKMRKKKKEKKIKEKAASFISLSHSDGNCKRVSTVGTSAKTNYPEGLEKKGLNITCLSMCSGFQKVQPPQRLVKAMKLSTF